VRLSAYLSKHRELLVVTLLALVVRLIWNLWVHPPLDYVFSDMAAYLERAQTGIDHPDGRFGYFTLFPWGTHVLLGLVKRLFGREPRVAIGVLYAVMGALSVSFTFALARRFARRTWAPRVVGAVLVVYYPWLSLGGYVLSETPFTLFLCATAWSALRLADRGRPRDAWLFGLAIALASIFRPQILISFPLLAVHFVLRRKAWRRPRLAALPVILAPTLLVLAFSAMRVHWHTGHYGGIAGNGPLNYAFGRCHATAIISTAPDRSNSFRPPSLGGLFAHEKEHPRSMFKLYPAMGTTLNVKGHMWDPEPMYALAGECIARTGLARQAMYAATHLALLWRFNVMWPDSERERFRPCMAAAQMAHNVLVLPAAIVGIALAFRRRRARALLIAVHVLGLMIVAMIYFGDTRLRAPYDGLLVVIAIETYACAYRALRRRYPARAPTRWS
jgi:hypothetical protein